MKTNKQTKQTKGLPSCLAIASAELLTIGRLEGGVTQKLHIREVPLGVQPRCITWGGDLRCILVSLELSEVEGALRLVDDATFETMGSDFALDAGELVHTSTYVPACDEAAAATGNAADRGYFVVGTAFYNDNHCGDICRGRVLIFAVRGAGGSAAAASAASATAMEEEGGDDAQRLVLVSSNDVDGAVYAIAPFRNSIVCSVSNRTTVLRWRREGGSGSGSGSAAAAATASGGAGGGASVPALLEAECNVDGQILTLALQTSEHSNSIVVADLMKSLTLLEYIPPKEGEDCGTLEERARELSTAWMTSVAMLGANEHTYVGATAPPGCNLFAARAPQDALTDEVRLWLCSLHFFCFHFFCFAHLFFCFHSLFFFLLQQVRRDRANIPTAQRIAGVCMCALF